MSRIAVFAVALSLGAPAFAQIELQQLPGIEEPASTGEPDKAKVRECAGEKFVFAWGAGARPTKVTLCSEPGATTEEVVRMLEDAAAKIEASAIPEDRRTAIAQQMHGKVAELKGQARPQSPPVQASRPAVVPAPAPVQAAPRPAPPAAPVVAQAPLPKPRLAIECYTPGELGSGGPCTVLARDTRLTVSARDALAAGNSLRFVRNGAIRGELALAPMRKGQSTRLTLPREVCSGVVEAETRIQVVRGGQVLDSLGPYLLRC